MAQSLAKILVHTVFSTKDRHPFLRDRAIRDELHAYLGGVLSSLGCQPLIVGGVEDHVHLLSVLSRTCTAADMVKEVKRGSSLWIKTKGVEDFAWQSGYGMFSIGSSQILDVKKYIATQEEHHRAMTYQDESTCPVNAILRPVVIWSDQSLRASGANHGSRLGVGACLAEADA